jgi:hypothetical protein
MTQDEIIDKLLFQAGANFGGDGINYEEFNFRKFAKLVAAKEREKFCALLRQLHDSISLASDPSAIKAKREQA